MALVSEMHNALLLTADLTEEGSTNGKVFIPQVDFSLLIKNGQLILILCSVATSLLIFCTTEILCLFQTQLRKKFLHSRISL